MLKFYLREITRTVIRKLVGRKARSCRRKEQVFFNAYKYTLYYISKFPYANRKKDLEKLFVNDPNQIDFSNSSETL